MEYCTRNRACWVEPGAGDKLNVLHRKIGSCGKIVVKLVDDLSRIAGDDLGGVGFASVENELDG